MLRTRMSADSAIPVRGRRLLCGLSATGMAFPLGYVSPSFSMFADPKFTDSLNRISIGTGFGNPGTQQSVPT